LAAANKIILRDWRRFNVKKLIFTIALILALVGLVACSPKKNRPEGSRQEGISTISTTDSTNTTSADSADKTSSESSKKANGSKDKSSKDKGSSVDLELEIPDEWWDDEPDGSSSTNTTTDSEEGWTDGWH
jgi:hypothetical protein